MSVRSILLALALLACLVPDRLPAAEHEFDVVIYGGTAGGAIAAIAAAREGVSVALLEPARHIGGMLTGGLSRTDHGRKEVIGGLSREFFVRCGRQYGRDIEWYYEPKVGTQVLGEMLQEAGVQVFLEQRAGTVAREGTRLVRLTTLAGDTFRGKVFLDASYEGDLLPRAGISYTWGREGRDVYGESLAGRHEQSPKHQFDVEISPDDADGKLLPLVYGGDPTPPGQGDKKVQAYNFRLCFSKDPDNRVPFPKPADYDPARFELLKRYLAVKGDALKLNQILLIWPLPNRKADINNQGPISTDYIGGSWDYPEADYAARRRIWAEHVEYVKGFLYFLANDPSVPKTLQEEMSQWGLAKDEFVGNDNWPPQLYIREARRMIGEYVMRQADLQTEGAKPDSIGMGSYNSDSHHVQRIPSPDGYVTNEGDMQVPVKPYEISYRAIIPKAAEATNLFVPVCFSSSHVAYSSMRMEPVYMIMGHSAGVAASWCVKNDKPVQQAPYDWLEKKLREQKQVLSMDDALPPEPKRPLAW